MKVNSDGSIDLSPDDLASMQQSVVNTIARCIVEGNNLPSGIQAVCRTDLDQAISIARSELKFIHGE